MICIVDKQCGKVNFEISRKRKICKLFCIKQRLDIGKKTILVYLILNYFNNYKKLCTFILL